MTFWMDTDFILLIIYSLELRSVHVDFFLLVLCLKFIKQDEVEHNVCMQTRLYLNIMYYLMTSDGHRSLNCST